MWAAILPIIGWISGGYVASDFSRWVGSSDKEEETEEERKSAETKKMIVRIVMIIALVVTSVLFLRMHYMNKKGGANAQRRN